MVSLLTWQAIKSYTTFSAWFVQSLHKNVLDLSLTHLLIKSLLFKMCIKVWIKFEICKLARKIMSSLWIPYKPKHAGIFNVLLTRLRLSTMYFSYVTTFKRLLNVIIVTMAFPRCLIDLVQNCCKMFDVIHCKPLSCASQQCLCIRNWLRACWRNWHFCMQ